MKYLSDLTSCTEVISSTANGEIPVEGLAVNSQKIKRNYLFFVTDNNEKYLEDAVKKGASVFVSEKSWKERPTLQVKNIRKAIASMSRAYFDYPDRDISVIGVVGTNGKTSTTYIMAHILRYVGFRCMVIGTSGVEVDGTVYPSERTTPDPPDLYEWLKIAKEQNIKYIIMEVSAHAVYFEKMYGLKCDFCIFTNITQDHLDFFSDMQTYSQVKIGYFTKENIKCGIINGDDDAGKKIIKTSNICCVSYGIKEPTDIFAMDMQYNNGTDFVANVFDDILYIHSPLYGEFNVRNVLSCMAVAKIVGIESKEIEKSIACLPEIEGRFNVINSPVKIIIDYAHTPDGLKNVLQTARGFCRGTLFVVFGCGGDRDRSKRPLMGKIATEYGDKVVLTNDNPRSENPGQIISEILSGIKKTDKVYTVIDRKEAISFALSQAKKGDTVLIAGKGCEKYMEIKGEKIPYNDKETCLALLEKEFCTV